MNSTYPTYLFPAAAIIIAFACYRWYPRQHPQEPPLVRPKIPLIGHIIGLIRNGIPYYTIQSALHPSLAAYTVDLLANKSYIINSPALVAAVQRSHRIISFDPFLTGAAKRMAGIDGNGLELLREEQSGGQGINNKVLHSMHPALLGPGLDQMNEKMIGFLKTSVDELAKKEDDYFDLHLWCRHAITVASTDAIYGKRNPYHSKDIQDSLWIFESNLSPLLINIFPRFTAGRSWRARERLVAALIKYYEANGQEDSSELTYQRWKVQHDAGATTEDTARLEAAAGIGILSNTVPSTFWTLFEIYSRPELLAEIRDEVSQHALHVDHGSGVHTIDLADIRDHCKLLVSSFQETLRLRSNGAPTRVVYEDIMLQDQYLLKAGSVLQMPAPTINRHKSTWGADSRKFDPRRFLKSQRDSKRVTGFMSFGASPNICPGRHFASGEILSLAAMLVLRYDLEPEQGVWLSPRLNTKAMAASITPPVEAFNVKAIVRPEFENTEWNFRVTPGKGKFSLITG